MVAGMADTGADEVRFVAEATYDAMEFLPEVVLVGTTDVGELDVLEAVPNVLVQRVQVRRITRQGLQVQALGRPTGEEVLDRLATMNGRHPTGRAGCQGSVATGAEGNGPHPGS
jgi:hypothetical protein